MTSFPRARFLTATIGAVLLTRLPAMAAPTGAVVADTFVRQTEPTKNFGTKSAVEADADPTERTFIGIQVQGLGSATVTSARLRLRVENDSNSAGSLHKTPCTWGETTLTWNTQGATPIGTLVAAPSGDVHEGDLVEFDVTSSIDSGDTLYCFVLVSSQTDGVGYHSREASSSKRPSFIITAAAGTTTTIATTTTTTTSSTTTTTSTSTTTSTVLVAPGGIPNDEKAGSILLYPLYTSGATSGNAQNTVVRVTNTSPTSPATVLMYLVSETCSPAAFSLSLAPSQTTSFLASDYDPGVSGSIVAIAVDPATGCPVDHDFLIGSASVKFASGHHANLGAVAVSRLGPSCTAGCSSGSDDATLAFDGVCYDKLPATVAVDNIPSRADGNDTLFVLNRMPADLVLGGGSPINFSGILYDDAANPALFTASMSCQFRQALSNSFPNTVPSIETRIPAGRTGWMKVSPPTNTTAFFGAWINFNANAGAAAGAFNGGRDFHTLSQTVGTATVRIPVVPVP